VNVTESGVPVPDVIDAVKRAIKAAGVSATDQGRDLLVGSVALTLHAVATRSAGGGLDFRVPFIGMRVQLGAKLTTRDTHEIAINLTPPLPADRPEIRDGGLDDVLADAIATIRAAVASAAGGDDPFVLKDSAITLSFAVTAEGSISVGVNGSLSDELTHTLTLALVPTGVLYGRGHEFS
jgi:Trypsin-co-occurring domain 2